MRLGNLAVVLAVAVAPLLLSSCATPAIDRAGALPSPAMNIGEHRATLNGSAIWYRVAGQRDGRSAPVVYLAGGPGGNSYSFEKIGGPQLERDSLVVY